MRKQPNVLLITSDQQHYNTLGATNAKIKTPALDRLCREGMRFERAYCSNPVCSPSRASIITGLYPAWHGCWTIGVKLPEDVPTVGDTFQQHGYSSILVGKAHFQPTTTQPGSESIECMPIIRDLDFWRNFHGPWYGFNHVETARMHSDEHLVGQHYAIWLEENGLPNWRDYFGPLPGEADWMTKRQHYTHPDRYHWQLPQEYHHTHWVGERTIANIETAVSDDQPFFLWSSFFDPHPPYIVSEPWASMYDPNDMELGSLAAGELDRMPPQYGKTQESQPDFSMYHENGGHHAHGFSSHRIDAPTLRQHIATYYGMQSFIDHEVGRILACLDRLGIADNTIVLYSTDHGHYLGQHGLIAKGAFHYEDMLRIPMIVRYPGQVPAGQVCSALQSQVDFAPTLLSACGIAVPRGMQGVDQLPVWCGTASSQRDKLIVENRHNPTTIHLRTYIEARYKITVYRQHDYGELFDLVNDPEERHNLWDEPEAAALKSRLLLKAVQAEIEREPTRMPRIAGA